MNMERTIYQGRTSLLKYWLPIGMGGLFFGAGVQLIQSPGTSGGGYLFALPGFLLVGFAYLSVRATSYTVTSQRLIGRNGLLSSRTSELAVSDVHAVKVKQGSTERLLGIGSVVISAVPPSEEKIVFAGIQKPQEVADKIPGRARRLPRRGQVVEFTKR